MVKPLLLYQLVSTEGFQACLYAKKSISHESRFGTTFKRSQPESLSLWKPSLSKSQINNTHQLAIVRLQSYSTPLLQVMFDQPTPIYYKEKFAINTTTWTILYSLVLFSYTISTTQFVHIAHFLLPFIWSNVNHTLHFILQRSPLPLLASNACFKRRFSEPQ